MYIFFAPDILVNTQLPESEAQHCVRVLRLKEGDQIRLTDGSGHFFQAVITFASAKQCKVEIIETINQPSLWNNFIEIAVAPTKNMERMEWFAEKATETGINKISFINCHFSERKELKLSRMEKIMISAMKQSMKATLPEQQDMLDFKKYICTEFPGQKFIAHCYPGKKELLSKIYIPGQNVRILIGPEGDFSEKEVNEALVKGYVPVSLGESRLRTETAALLACQTIHIVNQIPNSNR